MKISIEVDISVDEIPHATELFAVLHKISSTIRPKNTKKLFMDLFSKLAEGDHLDSVHFSIEKIYESTSEDCKGEVVEDFANAFIQIALSSDLLARGLTVQPYAILVSRLSHAFKLKAREKLVPKLIKFLAIPRSVDAHRADIFPYAETFACFIKLGLISVMGALTTIINLLKNEPTRCAGITMLGKSVELCLFEIKANCPQNYIAELEETLNEVHEEAFQYDLSYIRENIHMSLPTSLPPTDPPPAPPSQISNGLNARLSGSPPPSVVSSLAPSAENRQILRPSRSLFVHKDKIFAICYDSVRDNIITSCKDGSVTLWSVTGSPLTRIELGNSYAAAMDMNPKTGMTVVAGKETNEATQVPGIFVLDVKGTKDDFSLTLKDTHRKKDVKQFSAIKAFTHQNQFVVGESSPKQKRHAIGLYNVGSSSISNTTTFEEHEDVVTSFCSHPENEAMFFSGSKDCTIRLWDSRKPQSAGLFGLTSKELAGGLSPRPQGHTAAISSLDTLGNLLLTSDQKECILAWDIRSLGSSPPVQRYHIPGVLKVSLVSGRLAVVSTTEGLGLLDLDLGRMIEVPKFPDGHPQDLYNDLRLNRDKTQLFAAGGEGKVDIYNLT